MPRWPGNRAEEIIELQDGDYRHYLLFSEREAIMLINFKPNLIDFTIYWECLPYGKHLYHVCVACKPLYSLLSKTKLELAASYISTGL